LKKKDNIINSPEMLKLRTPTLTYKSIKSYQHSPIDLDNSPAYTDITPKTRTFVSQLIDMPSPVKKTKPMNTTLTKSPTKLTLKNNILQEKLNRIRRLLKQKRTIIKSLKTKINNNTKKTLT